MQTPCYYCGNLILSAFFLSYPLKFAVASPEWKQVQVIWNFSSMCRVVSIHIPVLWKYDLRLKIGAHWKFIRHRERDIGPPRSNCCGSKSTSPRIRSPDPYEFRKLTKMSMSKDTSVIKFSWRSDQFFPRDMSKIVAKCPTVCSFCNTRC